MTLDELIKNKTYTKHKTKHKTYRTLTVRKCKLFNVFITQNTTVFRLYKFYKNYYVSLASIESTSAGASVNIVPYSFILFIDSCL